VERNAQAFAKLGHTVGLLAAEEWIEFKPEPTTRAPIPSTMRSRSVAGLRTVLFGSNFFKEKFLTPSWSAVARERLASDEWTHIICSYIVTADLVLGDSRPVAVWTHNDEFKWFRTLGASATNPFAKLAARFSSLWTQQRLEEHASNFLYVHVTEDDRSGFAARIPSLRSVVQPVGTDLPSRTAAPYPAGAGRVNLLFVGSLSVTMNRDALHHFADRFWPVLKQLPDAEVTMTVAGSAPPDELVSFCQGQGWSIHADVDDETLTSLYERATFTVLAFPYATGAKLKMLASLSHGVPFLATSALGAQRDLCSPPSLISDDPREWAEALEECRRNGINEEQRSNLQNLVRKYAWDEVAGQLLAAL
jgi:glycosyltransferase involved in cell wall biosynthesis